MSPQSSNSPGIYDGLMLVATSGLIAGVVFLILELNKYGWQLSP
ncbi:MAG TPA: hypothetical protein VMM56_11540 [Planctomycetaceae bacterium]|nr:hypothetical protein [Planctomycetaceae bacterium]